MLKVTIDETKVKYPYSFKTCDECPMTYEEVGQCLLTDHRYDATNNIKPESCPVVAIERE